jgi:hypothetical protein
MGSIAAAVPGDNRAAQDAAKTGRSPGAESTVIRNRPETTAGTEVKLDQEEAGSGGKKPGGEKNAA